MGRLVAEIESQKNVINTRTEQVQKLEADLVSLVARASALEKSIQELNLQISAKDKNIESLTLNTVQRIHLLHYALGVNDKGEGVVFPMEVEIISSGVGTVSLDVSNVQFQANFQDSVRTAAAIASAYAGVSVSDKDIIVTVVNEQNNLIVVDGPSTGALVTAMIAAGLQDKSIDPAVLVTGAIKTDGKIDRVGGIPSKAAAAEKFGAKTLLVPKGQEIQSDKITIIGVSNIKELASRIIVD